MKRNRKNRQARADKTISDADKAYVAKGLKNLSADLKAAAKQRAKR